MQRKFDPNKLEVMDQPQTVSVELEQDLKNLRSLNRWFGSYALVRRFLRRWIKAGDRLRIADLATGSGDIPRLIVDFAREIGAEVRIDAVDRQDATLEIARKISSNYPEISFVRANVLEWDPADRYDIVFNTLALHHFSEDDAVRLLRRCRELSEKWVLVSDLRRGWIASLGVYFITATVYRDEMTKIDGRLSAERAFSFSEMRDLARRAEWKNFGQAKYPYARQAIWLSK